MTREVMEDASLAIRRGLSLSWYLILVIAILFLAFVRTLKLL